MKRSRIKRKPKKNPMPPGMYERVMREETRCRLCNRPGTDPEWFQGDEVHHIRNASMGGKDHSRRNLCRLCFTCHSGIDAHGKNNYPRSLGKEPLERGETGEGK